MNINLQSVVKNLIFYFNESRVYYLSVTLIDVKIQRDVKMSKLDFCVRNIMQN